MKKKFKIPEEDTGTKIRNKLVSPLTALQVLKEHYNGKKEVKDFIVLAIDAISEITDLSRSLNKEERQGKRARKTVKKFRNGGI